MKPTSPLPGIQQAGAPETTAFHLRLVTKKLNTSFYSISTNFHTELKPEVKVNHDMHSLAFTLRPTLG